jgi:hypothetical protein
MNFESPNSQIQAFEDLLRNARMSDISALTQWFLDHEHLDLERVLQMLIIVWTILHFLLFLFVYLIIVIDM